MKQPTTRVLLLWANSVKNTSLGKTARHLFVVTLIVFLLPLWSCSLFSGSWDDGIKLRKKGETFLAEKKYDESLEAFSKAIKIIENVDDRGNMSYGVALADCYKFRGTAYFKLKDYDKSLADFNRSIEVNRDGLESAYPERGKLFLVKKEFEKAIADFEKARPSYERDYRAQLGMGIAYFETEKYEKAGDYIFSALDKLGRSNEQPNYDPDDHIKAYEYSIKLFEQKGDTKKAELEKTSLEELKKKIDKKKA